jgi:LacI family transcriptional regulator
MRDVAEAAGVSLKTVSRVVNREEGVSDDLVHRVDTAVRSLRYVPDERARNLRQTDSRETSIGFSLVDVSNPFFSAVLRGLEEVARNHNCLVLSASSDHDPDRQNQLIETFLQRRVAGIVVVPCGPDLGLLTPELLRGTPVVLVDCEPDAGQFDIVRSDHYGGAKKLTQHLIAHGHTSIGFLGDDPNIFSAKLRLQGFTDAMEEAGLKVDPQFVITGERSPIGWQTEVFRWLQRLTTRPTAVMTAQNFVTMGAVRALHQLSLERTVALAGFDEIEMGDVVTPALTVLPQHPFELGRLAGELLFRRLEGVTEAPVRQILEAQVVPRGSGEIRP